MHSASTQPDLAALSSTDRVQAVAPGQSCVVYDGVVCLGGGIVSRPTDAETGIPT